MDAFPYPPFPPPPLAPNGAPKKVVIVGAGLAGLVAGHALAQAGHDVTILEASDHAGGRVCTLRGEFSDGLHAECGAAFVPGTHSFTVGYAFQFGLGLVPRGRLRRGTKFLAGWRMDDQHHARWPVQLTPDEQATHPREWMARYLAPGLDTVLTEDPRAPGWPSPTLHSLDAKSFGQFLADAGASPGAVSVIRRGFFDLWGDGVDACSALLILRDYAFSIPPSPPGTQPTPAASHPAMHHFGAPQPATSATSATTVATATAPLDAALQPPPAITTAAALDVRAVYQIDGGSDRLPLAFAGVLASRIRYAAPVIRIEQDADAARVYCAGDASPITADRVISAIPFAALRAVEVTPAFSTNKTRVIEQVPYTSVTRIFLEFERRFWYDSGLEGLSSTDLPNGRNAPIPGFWIEEATAVQPGVAGILDCYITGEAAREIGAMADDDRVSFTLDQVERVFPGARSNFTGRAASKVWDADPWARGGYVWFRPGQMTDLYPHVAPPEGRVHFAGEIASALPGWMQGALESGLRAAREVNDA